MSPLTLAASAAIDARIREMVLFDEHDVLLALPIDTSKISPMAVREYADFVMGPRLLTLPGVAQVVPIGGEVRQYQVQPDTARMAALGVDLESMADALKGFSGNSSGGFLELNSREYLIRNIGRTTRLAQELVADVVDPGQRVHGGRVAVVHEVDVLLGRPERGHDCS